MRDGDERDPRSNPPHDRKNEIRIYVTYDIYINKKDSVVDSIIQYGKNNTNLSQ